MDMFIVCVNNEENMLNLCDAQRKKLGLLSYAGNEGPDQTAHLRSLIWAFDVRKQNHCIVWNISTNKENPDQTA